MGKKQDSVCGYWCLICNGSKEMETRAGKRWRWGVMLHGDYARLYNDNSISSTAMLSILHFSSTDLSRRAITEITQSAILRCFVFLPNL